jgi:hypothetical protein
MRAPGWTRRAIVPVVVATVAASSSLAHAEVPKVCLTAPVEGQELQRAGKLLAARDKYTACGVPACPAEIVSDCLAWLRQVDDAMPGVVLAARDTKGDDLADVQVSIDGGAPAPTGTRAVRLDPGSHSFVFDHAGMRRTQQVVLREGEKNREVFVVFEAEAPARAVAVSRPVPVAAWIAGGVGAAALATFGAFGTIGVAQRSSDHCDSPGCPADEKSSVDSKFLVADVALGVGLVALAAATWLYLTRPTVEKPAEAVTLDPGVFRLRF